MKVFSLVTGILIGVIIGIGLTRFLPIHKPDEQAINKSLKNTVSDWHWPDSLDAAKAAPANHRIIFENDKVRILEVLLRPYESEPMHTHKLPSIMFGPNDTEVPPFNIIYYRYGYDSIRHKYFVKDSVKQHNEGNKPGEPDSGYFMKPEAPHAIKNLSNVTIDVYRVELK